MKHLQYLRKQFWGLLVLVFLLPLARLQAEQPDGFRARVLGLAGFESLVPVDGSFSLRTLPAGQEPDLRLIASAPGLGRVKIRFDVERGRASLPLIEDEFGQLKPEPKGITVLRGNFTSRTGNGEVAGSIYNFSNRSYLLAAFVAKSRRTGRNRFYRIRVPLIGDGGSRIAGLSRVTKLFKAGETCQQVAVPEMSHQHDEDHVEHSSHAFEIKPMSSRLIELHIHTDGAFRSAVGASQANTTLTTMVNEAENFYQNDLATDFQVVNQIVSTADFGSTDAAEKLFSWQNFISASGFFGDADAYHLFTGEDLDGGTVGIAFLSQVCRNPAFAVGVNQMTTSTVTAVTFAHELGHNLSLPHVNGGIMNAFVSFPSPTNFTSASVSTYELYMAQLLLDGQFCLETDGGSSPTPTPTPNPTPTPTPGPTATVTPGPTSSPNPTATNTPGDGGGGGGGGSAGDGDIEPPPVIDFLASLGLRGADAGVFQMTVTVDPADLGNGVQVFGYYSNKRGKLGTLFFQGTSTTSVTNFSAIMSQGAKAARNNRNRGRRRRVGDFIRVLVKKGIGTSSGSSQISGPVKITPERIRRRGRKLPKKRWYRTLGQLIG